MAGGRFPRLFQAMQQAAHLVQRRWQSIANRLLTTSREREAYAQGFPVQPPPVVETEAGLQTTVVNTSRLARALEYGQAAYHLPSRINWGLIRTARRSKSGRYYLLIPFRHYSAQRGSRAAAGSPTSRRAMLTRAVYEVARRLRPGQFLTAGPSHGRAVHAPGLHPYVPALPQNVRPGYTHAALQEGLRRVPGARRGSGQYLTFRTMTSDSPGWWIPAKPPRPVVAETVRTASPDVQRLLTTAAVEDVREQIRDALKGWPGAH
jgi:hypothetical protein